MKKYLTNIPSNKSTPLFILFVLGCTIFSSIFFIVPDFINYPTEGFNGLLYKVGHIGLICIPTFLFLYLISINKFIFSILFPLFSFLGSIIGFFSFNFNAVLTPMIIDATFNNDIGTTLDMISFSLIAWVFMIFAFSILLVYIRFKFIDVHKFLGHLFISIVLMFVIFSINSRVRNSFYQHYPFSVLYNLNEYKNLNVNKKSVRINPDSTLRFKTKDSLTIVLVIGESLRADHLFINGYKRNTNPCLSKVKNIVSFNRIYSEYTYTNPSVAHMLTRSDSVNKNRAQTETSFIPIFKSVGFFTAWIANQDAANTYVEFMNECDTLIYANPDKSVYSYSKWIDGDLLPIYQKILNRSEKNKLIILHTIGSHWYYNNHYTKDFEFFMPITKSKIISQNSREEIIDSYDNSVLYTDAFIDKIISKLQNINAIMIYLSDHGESLGEKGNWLHASENEYLKNPACLVWCSNIYIKKNPSKFEALKYNKSKRFRTDFLFHSILSGGNIPSKVISKDLDIFAINK